MSGKSLFHAKRCYSEIFYHEPQNTKGFVPRKYNSSTIILHLEAPRYIPPSLPFSCYNREDIHRLHRSDVEGRQKEEQQQ